MNSFSFLNTMPFIFDSGGLSSTFKVLGSKGFGGGKISIIFSVLSTVDSNGLSVKI